MPWKDEDFKENDAKWWQAQAAKNVDTDTGATTKGMLDYTLKGQDNDPACVPPSQPSGPPPFSAVMRTLPLPHAGRTPGAPPTGKSRRRGEAAPSCRGGHRNSMCGRVERWHAGLQHEFLIGAAVGVAPPPSVASDRGAGAEGG